METPLEARMIELETRFSHQEHLLAQLDDALVGQRREIDALTAEVRRLKTALEAARTRDESTFVNERPPHY